MDTKKVIDHIVQWLKNYAAQSGNGGFVIGVSGGVDSALTSTLCALTGLEVLCLEMPIHQASSQVNRAQNHINWLKKNYPNVREQHVELTGVFDALVNALPQHQASEQQFLALANTRARLRMSTLYYFAGLHRYLVAGT